MKNLSLLKKIARQGIEVTSSEDIIRLSCAYWHENFLPDITDIELLPVEQKKIVGYLTEFYTTFNCVEHERALTLLTLSNELKKQLKPAFNPLNTDEIAAEWGLSENMNKYHQDILFYQTRHYTHNDPS